MDLKLGLLKRAYSLLDSVTPLKYDCGVLCGGKCCAVDSIDGSENPGMLLLPYEQMLTSDASFSYKQSGDERLLICQGRCDRSKRPFSCRIFPFYASIDKGGSIHLKKDPRAFNTCPVSIKKKGTRHSVYFHRNAVRAVRLLLKDEDFKRELIKTSDFCDGLYDFYRKMIK